MGNFEIGNRNERRMMLIGFALKNNLQIANSFFYTKKSQKMDLERTEQFCNNENRLYSNKQSADFQNC